MRMSFTKDQLKTEAMKLKPAEREALAEELLQSIDATDADAIDAAWLAEVERRDAEFQTGKAVGIPVEDVLARLRAKATK
jgi:putative addiction module component (TIGR02574 family)